MAMPDLFGLGGLGFAAPLALLALIGLPLVWLVVRAIPPRPNDVIFPPTKIVAGLAETEETPAKAPPWLAIVRALALALVFVGLAAPSLNPKKGVDSRPLLIIIDNGWTSAPIWSQLIEEAQDTARAASGPVRILFTAPASNQQGPVDVLLPARAAASLAASQPQPLLSDHSGTISRLAGLPSGQRIVWFSDNVARPATADFGRALGRLGEVKLRIIPSPVIAVTRAEVTSAGYNLGLVGSAAAPSTVVMQAVDARGRTLSEAELPVSGTGVTLPVETALARNVAALRVATARSAGGTYLLDAFDRRVRTGLVAARQDDQPLLSDAYYLEEALRPYAEITRGDSERLAGAGLDVILLPDAAALPAREEKALEAFIEKGGILVRFAGPKLISAGQSITLPAPVSNEVRTLRGALAWDNAGSVAGFERSGPFAGLTIPADARINQVALLAPQASANGGQAPQPQIWARLSDTTPLVSAAPLGRGWRVLFHTTAGPAWSDVAFSGLQVSMLRRVLAKAASSALPATAIAPTAPLKPTLVLDGFGNLQAPNAQHLSIAPINVASQKPDARHPPGIYEGGGSRLILQAAGRDTFLPALPAMAGIERLGQAGDRPFDWGPPLLALGVAMMILDLIIAMLFAKAWRFPPRLQWPRGMTAALVILCCIPVLSPHDVYAQTVAPAQQRAPIDLSLAYIRTGDAATDARAKAGLEGLSRVLAARTSVEPGPVIAVDPARDDLALFPLLYWLLPDTPRETTTESARALDTFMKSGGVLFVDSRGAGRDAAAARAISRAALRGIEAPPLETVPEGHVLTKAFYILRGFPGRYQNARLWVETGASAAASANDGVSALIVGDGDWASAWATATPVMNFGISTATQRNQEIAARVGVNVVMYALTGNYKADQVHFETLLKRLTPR